MQTNFGTEGNIPRGLPGSCPKPRVGSRFSSNSTGRECVLRATEVAVCRMYQVQGTVFCMTGFLSTPPLTLGILILIWKTLVVYLGSYD